MYQPQGAGHTAKEAPRAVAQDDLGELVERAQKWLGMPTRNWEEEHKGVLALTEGITISAAAAGSLARHPQLITHEGYNQLGFFISVLYNERCPETVINYPHDTPRIWALGHRLPSHKVLIVEGTVGRGVGWWAKGPIIILGTGYNCGFGSTGPIIALRQAHIDRAFKGTLVGPEEYEKNVDLKTYVDRLLALAKENSTEIGKVMGNGIEIVAEIKRRIGGKS